MRGRKVLLELTDEEVYVIRAELLSGIDADREYVESYPDEDNIPVVQAMIELYTGILDKIAAANEGDPKLQVH